MAVGCWELTCSCSPRFGVSLQTASRTAVSVVTYLVTRWENQKGQHKKTRHKIYQGRKLSRLITLSINSTWLVVLKPDEEMGMAGMLNSFVMIYLARSDWAEGEWLSNLSLCVGGGDSSKASGHLGPDREVGAGEMQQHHAVLPACLIPRVRRGAGELAAASWGESLQEKDGLDVILRDVGDLVTKLKRSTWWISVAVALLFPRWISWIAAAQGFLHSYIHWCMCTQCSGEATKLETTEPNQYGI